MRKFVYAGAPTDSVGVKGGAERAPEVLRDLGLVVALDAIDAGNIDCLIRGTRRDAISGLKSAAAVAETTAVLRRRVSHLISDHHIPFIAGGCCSILPGALAGACDGQPGLGKIGLIYVDGHMDLYDGDISPTGEAADMALGAVLGLGPEPWMAVLGSHALVNSEDVVLLGFRDREDAETEGALVPEDLQPKPKIHDVDNLREMGPAHAGRAATAKLDRSPGRFWLHIDVDVLDELVFPATDYLMPGGLDWEELTALLRPIFASPAMCGVSLACYNPDKDTGASCGLRLVDMFRAVCRQ